jgi:hypothetical protein
MSKKRYPRVSDESAAKEPRVKEAKARAYAREKDKENTTKIALKIGSVKRHLKKPIKRSKKEITWALEIAGIGEGPADLSENVREDLYNHK